MKSYINYAIKLFSNKKERFIFEVNENIVRIIEHTNMKRLKTYVLNYVITKSRFFFGYSKIFLHCMTRFFRVFASLLSNTEDLYFTV